MSLKAPFASRILDGLVRDRLLVLMYHRVRAQPDPLFPEDVDARLFAAQLSAIRRHFTPLALPEALARIRGGALPPRAVCVTFDDGYADNFSVAAPLLQAAAVPATFFIATDFLDGGQMWNDAIIEAVRAASGPRVELTPGEVADVSSLEGRRRTIAALLARAKYLPPTERRRFVEGIVRNAGGAAPGSPMMSSRQLVSLRDQGMEIGAHTCSHPILTTLSLDAAAADILRSKQVLESILGSRVSLFAYPNGEPDVDYDLQHVRLVRESGFDAAVSTAPGYADLDSDILQLPRVTPWVRSGARFATRLFRAFLSPQRNVARRGALGRDGQVAEVATRR
jgi:peptidoglycan/xylan/chitin deacetylase (PgdA/CDA1 family)